MAAKCRDRTRDRRVTHRCRHFLERFPEPERSNVAAMFHLAARFGFRQPHSVVRVVELWSREVRNLIRSRHDYALHCYEYNAAWPLGWLPDEISEHRPEALEYAGEVLAQEPLPTTLHCWTPLARFANQADEEVPPSTV